MRRPEGKKSQNQQNKVYGFILHDTGSTGGKRLRVRNSYSSILPCETQNKQASALLSLRNPKLTCAKPQRCLHTTKSGLKTRLPGLSTGPICRRSLLQVWRSGSCAPSGSPSPRRQPETHDVIGRESRLPALSEKVHRTQSQQGSISGVNCIYSYTAVVD